MFRFLLPNLVVSSKKERSTLLKKASFFPSLRIGKCIDFDYAATEDNILILSMANDL